jgi:flagellar biosynthesis protein FlhF
MTLKSYFSPTVEAAMAQAAKELGPEAMLVYSREAPAESRSWGRYEVVFGWEMNTLPAAGPPAAVETERIMRAPIPPTPVVAPGHAEPMVKGVEKQLPPLPSAPAPAVRREAGNGASTDAESWQSRLLEFGFSGPIGTALAAQFQREGLMSKGPVNKPVSRAFWSDLEQSIPVAEPSELRRASVVILAGPPGAGKTMALANLASRAMTVERRLVHLVATDAERICGGQWLERFARLADAQFSMAESLTALDALVRAEPPGRLLLVEASAGLASAGAGWPAFRRRNPTVQVHLLLPVTHRAGDLRSLLRRYRGLEPDRIIAARMDESSQTGAVCCLAAEMGLPLSYVTSGAAIPGGLEQASLERLMQGVLDPIGVEIGGGV